MGLLIGLSQVVVFLCMLCGFIGVGNDSVYRGL